MSLLNRANLILMLEDAPLRLRVMAALHELAVADKVEKEQPTDGEGGDIGVGVTSVESVSKAVLSSKRDLMNESIRLWDLVIQDATILEKGSEASDDEIRAAVLAALEQ